MSTDTKARLCRPATCKTCPFRGGFYLNYHRRAEIHRAVAVEDKTFHCHSEVDYDDESPDTHSARQCAGATTLQLRADDYNQVMRWEGRLGLELEEDPAVPFQSWAEWIAEPEFSMDAPKPDPECCDGDCDGHTCEVVGDDCECPAGWIGNGGVANNADRLESPAFCSACGSAMCPACTSGVDDGGHPLCVTCAWEEE